MRYSDIQQALRRLAAGLVVLFLLPALAFGFNVELEGTCTDAEDGDLGPAIVWSSSIDGEVAVGANPTVDLSDGLHTITMTCTDSGGKVFTDSVTHEVADNQSPVGMLIQPQDGGCSGPDCP